MASVHPRTNRDGTVTTYQVRWREAGTNPPRVQTERFDEEAQANAFKDLVDQAGQHWPAGWIKGKGFVHHDVPHRFRDFALKVVAERTGIEPRTRRDLNRFLEMWIFPTFGEADIRSTEHFSRSTISQWIRTLEQTLVTKGPAATSGKATAIPKPMSPNSIRKYYWLLSSILNEAVRHEPPLRERNPCVGIRLPREDGGTDDGMEFLTPQEVQVLLDACFDQRADELLVVIKYGTGLRWGEITALQPQDIIGLHTSRPRLKIQRAWKKAKDGTFYLGPPKSKRSRRTIGISPTVVAALVEAGATKKRRDALLFTGADGASRLAYSTFSQRWHKAVTLAQERGLLDKYPTPHDLRHSHAAALISAGQPLTAVQRRLGHESIQTTSDRYGHLLPELEADGLAAIETALAGERPALRVVS